MWYKVNFDKLQLLITPPFLRLSMFNVFASVAFEPLKDIYNRWLQNRDDRAYYLNHYGQVCYLRKVLNDRFDTLERRIIIGNGNEFDRTYLYTRIEKRPIYLGQQTLYSRRDYGDTGVDFIVHVPEQIIKDNPYAITALVNEYKQDVKRFKIIAL